ncbi:MAG: translation initiation factor IF-2 [Candidatus Geothermincolia bacterium]
MAVKRVHELAKELGLESKQLLAMLEDMGAPVANVLQSVDDATQAELAKKLKKKTTAKTAAAEKPSAAKAAAPKARETAEKPAAPKTAAAKDAAPKHAPAKGTAAKPAPAKAAETKQVPAKEAASKAGPVKEAPAKQAPAKEAAPKPAPGGEAKSGHVPAKEAAPKPAPAKTEPAKAEQAQRQRGTVEHARTEQAKPAAPPPPRREQPPVRPGAPTPQPKPPAAAGEGAAPAPGAPRPPAGGQQRYAPGGRPRGGGQRYNQQRRDGRRPYGAQRSAPSGPKVEQPARKKQLRLPSGITVKDFAQAVGKTAGEIIKMLMGLGEMASMNQSMTDEAVRVLAEEIGFEVEVKTKYTEEPVEVVDRAEELVHKAPVVTVMGHVDHGKTSLLDAIRNTDVIATESGGITQHIGAYQVSVEGKSITFIDTPGHESFTSMRARGAQITDIAVLVVAADDGVMPQTQEAVDHARAAGVPIVVAVNKIDKEGANPTRVRQQLSEHNLVPEEWGGDTVYVDISAKQGENIDHLLEMILLVADLQELKANAGAEASGVVIEAQLDRGRGPVATVLVQRGTLHVGDAMVAGICFGRVRAMLDEHGRRVKEAGPAMPVEVVGLSAVPNAGDDFTVLRDERRARALAQERSLRERTTERAQAKHVTLDDLFERLREDEIKELHLILKADVQGSLEAVSDALERLPQDQVKINLVHRAVGGITESDVMLASASDAIIIGFNVRPDAKSSDLAEREGVDVRLYRVIYQLLDDIKAASLGMLEPEYEEITVGRAEIIALFRVPKIGAVAGAMVQDGVIARNSRVRLVRDGVVIYEGRLGSLRRFKDDVKEVRAGFDCGLTLENFQDVKEGDIVEAYELKELARTL